MYTRAINCFCGLDLGGIKAISLKRTLSASVAAFFCFSLPPGLLLARVKQDVQFAGTYANLKPAQRALVDEWFRQYNEMAKQNLKPAEEYEDLLFSVRTTFEAVTHTLITSKLTDKDGRSLGTAIDVIAYLETVHGKIPEASGELLWHHFRGEGPRRPCRAEASLR